MLTDSQQTVGAARLSAGRLTESDITDLLAAFRRWLSSRAGEFPDMPARLAAATGPTAEKLAGILVLLKKQGFSNSKFHGGTLGIESDKKVRWSDMVAYALGLLYDLPGKGPIDNIVGQGSRSTSTRVVLKPCR